MWKSTVNNIRLGLQQDVYEQTIHILELVEFSVLIK